MTDGDNLPHVYQSNLFNTFKWTSNSKRKNLDEHETPEDHSHKRIFSCRNISITLVLCHLIILVIAALILPSVVLYLMIPSLLPYSQNSTNVLPGGIYAAYCGGVSLSPQWTPYTRYTMYTSINTSNCHFNITPLYLTSIGGTDRHEDIAGFGALYGVSTIGFKIYVQSYSHLNYTQILSYSQTYNWSINWVGVYY